DLAQSRMERAEAACVRFPLKSLPYRLIFAWADEDSLEQRPQIQSAAAAHDRLLPSCRRVTYRTVRQLTVARGVEVLVRIDDVDQMMRHALSRRQRRLRRTDVHVPINELRIGVDDFAAHLKRRVDRDFALAYAGRSQDHDKLGLHWRRESTGERHETFERIFSRLMPSA